MARKPKESNQATNLSDRVFDEQSFVDGVFNDEYVIVVGSGVIFNREQFPESGGDINQYIINEINKDRRKRYVGFVDHHNFTDVFRGTSLDEPDPIYRLLSEFEYDLSDISPELSNLLRTKLFRFVLTTTIDSYVETLMRDIWGDELRIVNISDNQSLKDFQDALEHCRMNKYNQPTLFYVFGKVQVGRPKPRGYVETDVDAIKVIEKWLTMVDKKYIVPFLKSKRLLAVGCIFDDWYFRFFWYILTRSFDERDREGAKDIDGNLLTCDNLAALFDPNNPSDQQLKAYLQRRGVCMHNDVWAFMTHIYEILTSTKESSPFRRMILEKRRSGGIFISYKSCDVMRASELFCKLSREQNLNVWFDNSSLHGGDDYTSVIRTAIKNAKIFIPILSPSIASDLKEMGCGINTYYSDEWRWASENKQLIVLPMAIDGYNLRSEENKIFEKIVAHESSGIDMTRKPLNPIFQEKVGYAKVLESIMTHLGIS